MYRASTTKVFEQQNRFAPEQRGATTKPAIIKNPDTPFQTESLPEIGNYVHTHSSDANIRNMTKKSYGFGGFYAVHTDDRRSASSQSVLD